MDTDRYQSYIFRLSVPYGSGSHDKLQSAKRNSKTKGAQQQRVILAVIFNASAGLKIRLMAKPITLERIRMIPKHPKKNNIPKPANPITIICFYSYSGLPRLTSINKLHQKGLGGKSNASTPTNGKDSFQFLLQQMQHQFRSRRCALRQQHRAGR